MRSDALFILGVLLFFFILWFASGGPTHPISFAGPYITPITDIDTVQEGYGDGTAWNGNLWSDFMGNAIGDNLTGASNPSPFSKSVSVTSAAGAYSTDPDQEYVIIRASGTEPIDITGWRVVSGASGRGARIPAGAALPRSGSANATGHIVLQPGDEAYIVTGESPSGISFKENKCTGYLARRQEYAPPLQMRCPSAAREFDANFTGNELRDDRCYYRMQSTPVCETPSDRDVSNFCIELIDEYLTYNGCVENHRADSDFDLKTWRIYLEYENSRGKSAELWKPTRDAVKLLDAEGRTVDLYTY